jgi:hypothetical protein
MTTTTFLAQFWGWLLIILSLIFLLKGDHLMDDLTKLVKDRTFVILSGYLSLILGLMTIILHNFWFYDWRSVVTLFGWISLFKGIVRISYFKAPEKTMNYLKKSPYLIQGSLFVAAILGIWLVWMSCNYNFYY